MATPPSTNASDLPASVNEVVEEQPAVQSDEVIRIEDLAPRQSVKGGRKILLGEDMTRHERPL